VQLPVDRVEPALPDFRYQGSSGGIMENEICPVYLAGTEGQPRPDPTETDTTKRVDWAQFLHRLAAPPERFTPWSLLQAGQLQPAVDRYLTKRP
jgi:isopentenyl-diphosphate delta-isomerase